jgi:hypothetical protein
MNHFGLTIALFVASSTATTTNEIDTVRNFYRVMKKAVPTIANFTSLFGNDSEAELDAVVAVYYPGATYPATSERILKFTRERLANRGHASEFLGCIRRLRPQLFSPRSMPRIERVTGEPGEESFTKVVARTRAGDVVFVFTKTATTIEDIEMPGDGSVYELIRECGRHLRRSRSPP